MRRDCVVAQYTTEAATHRTVGPSTAALLEVKTIDNTVKTKPQEAKKANTLLKSLRDKYIGALQVAMAPTTARIEVARLCAAIVRTLFGKSLAKDMCWGASALLGTSSRRGSTQLRKLGAWTSRAGPMPTSGFRLLRRRLGPTTMTRAWTGQYKPVR